MKDLDLKVVAGPTTFLGSHIKMNGRIHQKLSNNSLVQLSMNNAKNSVGDYHSSMEINTMLQAPTGVCTELFTCPLFRLYYMMIFSQEK